MNKILRYSFMALMAMMFGNVMADEVTMAYPGGTTTNMTGNNDAALVGLNADEWSVVAAKGGNTNFPGLNKAGDIRLYYHANGGNTITVESLSGATINSITATFNSATVSNMTVTVNGNPVTGTDGTFTINSTSFVLGNGNTSNVQVQIKSLVINYSASGDPRAFTTIAFADGYQTQIGGGPGGMFPQIGQSVALPTATVKAGDVAVAGAAIDWSLDVKSWKPKKEGGVPSIADGKIIVDGRGEIAVKASFAGNGSYKPSEKSYTLKVYNSYGLLKEMVNDIVDKDLTSDDDNDGDGALVFYFFRNIDAEGFPVVTNTVTYVNGSYIYLTDGQNNNLLFYGTNSQKLKAGDVISGNVDENNLGGFWGNLKRHYKLPEFAFTDMNVKVESSGAAPDPKTITVDKLKDNINAYVKIENAVFKSASSKNFVFIVGENELAVYNQWNVANQSSEDKKLEVGATYTLTGMGSIYKKGTADAVYQLYLAGFEMTAPASVNAIKTNAQFSGKMYNVAGQVVNKGYKGLVIQDGRKFVNK